MTAIDQVHNFSGFSGGEGDGFYLGPKNSYRLGKNIDTRQLENGVKICTKIVDTEATYDGDILAVNPYASNSFSTQSGNNGKIYKDGLLKITLSSGTSAYNYLRGFGKMTRTSDNTTYVYGISGTSSGVGKIFRIATDYSTATDLSQDFTLAEGRTANANYMPVLSLPGRIIFAYANTVFQLSNGEIQTELISFPKDSEIVSITYYQDTYKIYYNVPKYSGGPNISFVSYWDGLSSSVDTFISYNNSGVLQVINDGAYDYAIFGNTYSNDIYLMEGLNRKEIRVNTENSTNNTRLILTKGTIREGILYLTGKNKLGEYCLYSYGSYYPGMPKSLMPENSGTYIDEMYAGISDMYIYVDNVSATGTGAIYTKSFLFSGTSETTGTLYTYPITGNYGIYTLKSIKEIDISYNLTNSNDTIKIYVKTSGGPTASNATGRTLIKTISDNSVRGVKIYGSELSALSIGTWNQLEYKIELNNGYTDGPYLHQIRTLYSDNIG